MNHLGDITKIRGCAIPAVDCVIGGSPCQDLSIAGKRAGLAGARSGLYMEQIRLIKEMRWRDTSDGWAGMSIRPRYMVWENVPGAFSSNGGKDFAAVLEEAIKVAEPKAPAVPVPEKGWPTSGCLMGDEWSVAWRVFDAQFWGVPQRRRRIALVADFGGKSAPEILFVRKGLSGDSEPGSTAGEGLAGSPESGTSYAVRIRGGCDGGGKGALVQEEKSGTSGCNNDQTVFCLQGNGIDRANSAAQNGGGWWENVAYTLNTIDRPAVCAGFSASLGAKAHGIGYMDEQAPTLSSQRHDASVLCLNDQGGSVMGVTENVTSTLRAQENGRQPIVAFAANQRDEVRDLHDISCAIQAQPGMKQQTFVALDMSHACDVIRDCGEISPCLQARMGTGGNQVPLTYQMQGFGEYRAGDVASSCKQRDSKGGTDLVCAVDCRNGTENTDVNGTLQAKSNGGTSYNLQNVVRENMLVRRLTPLECERLQGFPDGWTDIGDWVDSKGKKRQTADSARYKALGNSIALPPWKWVLKRLCAQYERDATMASLFDGIGGFPLIWEQLNGKGSCLWASEIEEFPMAVTKRRFP